MKEIFINFSQLAASELMAKALGFVTMVYLARILGAEAFGLYGFVGALSTYAVLFSNFGIEQYSTRQLSSNTAQASSVVITSVIGSRVALSLIFSVVFVVGGYFYANNISEQLLFLFQSLSIVAFAFNLQFFLVATKSISFLSVMKGGVALGVCLLTVLFIHNTNDLAFVSLISGVVTLAVFIIGAGYLYSKNKWAISLPSFRNCIDLVTRAAPLGFAVFMIQIYRSADIIFLGFTNPGTELGYYTGAYRIITVLTLLPGILYLTYVPYLAKITAGFFLSHHTRQYISLLVVSGTLISAGCFYFSDLIVLLVLGQDYLPASDVFRVLLINVYLVYLNIAFAHLLIAWDQHKKYLFVVSTGAGINIFSNILLIPSYGIMGAAIATVFAEFAVLIVSLYYHYRLHGLFAMKGSV
ncbi:MAG: flippase [Bacteroidota bacterium]